jgi:hypothetical protein
VYGKRQSMKGISIFSLQVRFYISPDRKRQT